MWHHFRGILKVSMSQIQDVKAANDIVTIVGERIALKPAGTYLKGLCPFHSEKTASFFVSPILQRFKCYGCGEGGDVISFLEKYDNLTFYEALQTLAERAGIALTSELQSGEDKMRSEMLTALGLARDYYHFLLSEHKTGEKARQYLRARGITSTSIKLFQLGYSLPNWDGLIKFLHNKKNISLPVLEKAGLIIAGKYGRQYDRFRDRIMFPLKDSRGLVVGFSGRLLSPDAKEAKYVNSPETPLYHKSKLLFGYSELKREIAKKRQVVVVEGEFDVISSTQAQVNHVVAIKGSALTNDHGQLLARVADTVILSLDTDSAGMEATKKSIQVLKPFDVELRIAQLPSGKDPDELAQRDAKSWRTAVKRHISAYEFLINASVQDQNLNLPRIKRSIIKQLAPVLWNIDSQVEKEFYVQKLADLLAVDLQVVMIDIKTFAEHPQANVLPRTVVRNGTKVDSKISRPDQLARYLVFLILQAKDSQLSNYLIWLQTQSNLGLPSLLQQLQIAVNLDQTSVNMSQLPKSLPADLAQTLMDVVAEPEFVQALSVSTIAKEWDRASGELLQEIRQLRREKIKQELDQLHLLNTVESNQRQAELLAELARL